MADLSQPATLKHLKQTVDNMKTYVSDVTDDLVSEEALNTKLEDYAKTEDIHDAYDDTEIKNSIAKLPTKEYVAEEISKAVFSGSGVDLSDYVTNEQLEEALKDVDVDLTGYATETYVGEKIAEIEIPSTEGLVSEDALNNKLVDYAKHTDLPTTLPASDVHDWAKAQSKPEYTADEVGADAVGSADKALSDAKDYTDGKIDALVGDGASTTLDTIGEISKAIEDHKEVTDALNAAIGNKANESDLTSHTGNTTIHITDAERTDWNAAKTHADSTHAPSDAEKNIIVGIQKNGTDVSVNSTTRKVNITVPTKTSELANDSGFKTTDTTYDVFVKSGEGAASGLVPAPSTTAGTTKYLREDGQWVKPTDTTYTNAKLGQGYARVSNGTETAITASISNYTLTKDGVVILTFQNAVPANATLNINSKGAKPIYFDKAAIKANTLYAGDTGFFMYDGTNYNLVHIGYNGTDAGLMQAVARSASCVPNTSSTITDDYEIVGTTATSLMRFTPSAIGNYIAKNAPVDDYYSSGFLISDGSQILRYPFYEMVEGLIGDADGLLETIGLGNKGSRTNGGISKYNFWRNETNGTRIECKTSTANGNLDDEITIYTGLSGGTFPSLKIGYDVKPGYDNEGDCGSANNRWCTVYSASGVQTTSDRSQKKDVVKLDADATTDFIMGLNPVSYKFIDGKSGRTHYGMISQDVEELLKKLGMSSLDFAGFTKAPKVDKDGNAIEGEYNYFLRYEEFIAPLIKVVQTQQNEIENLKNDVAELKAIVEELKNKYF